MFSLKDKVAIVTGGASGLGLSISKRFIEAGAKVTIADISENSKVVADKIGAIFIKTDVSSGEDIQNLIQKTVEVYGKIDILINNAGITGEEATIKETEPQNYRKTLDVNFMGVINGIKYIQDYMNDEGAIINTASLGGVIGFPGYSSYGASKAAVVEITKTAALELADRRIRVNCICPATVNTPMAYEDETELALSNVIWPLRRMAEPEEVAAVVHFLAADDCKYITGQAINIDGGYTAGIGMPIVEKILSNQ